MPMDQFWIPLLTTLLLHQTTSASDTTELIRAVGGSVTFRTQDSTKGNAFWSFGTEPIATASFGDPPQVLFLKQTFETRFAVSEKGRALSISQLRLEDAGNYSVKINDKRYSFTLRLFRELAEPTVACEAQNCSGGSCRFSLRCSTSGNHIGKVSYTWRVGDQPWDEGPVVVLVNKSSLEEPEPLTCTAHNPVSSRNVTVTTPGMLCTETSMHPPGLGTLSSSGVTIWLLATIGVAVLLLVLLLFLRKFTGWRKFHLSRHKPTDTGGVLGQLPALFPGWNSQGIAFRVRGSIASDLGSELKDSNFSVLAEGKINGFCPPKAARNLGFKQTNKQNLKKKKGGFSLSLVLEVHPNPTALGESGMRSKSQPSSSEGFWGQGFTELLRLGFPPGGFSASQIPKFLLFFLPFRGDTQHRVR
uniref:Ig-like domain-containing protein n=1 Tax=Ficedula albicollis TaxID=59894 RepID=A0A803V423_FICAL